MIKVLPSGNFRNKDEILNFHRKIFKTPDCCRPAGKKLGQVHRDLNSESLQLPLPQ